MAYRWLVSLYPYEFRRTYRDELEADFEEAHREAAASGPVAVARLWLRVVADLVVSVPREWLRTPWLAVLTAAAIAAAIVFYYVVGRVYRAGSFAAAPQPPESPQLLLLMGLMVLVPTTAVILISAVSQFFRVRPPGPRRRV